MDFSTEINGRTLEFLDDIHAYLVDGVQVPSITQMLKFRFPNKYAGVDANVLQRASQQGTEAHEAIEAYCRFGTESDLPEVRNFKFLQKQYGFQVIDNEVPVILCKDGEPISAGRLDMVIQMDDQIGLADIKRTYTLDKEYLALQLNLYRLAFMQSYGMEVSLLRGIHLREDVRKFVTLPINEGLTWDFINEFLEANK